MKVSYSKLLVQGVIATTLLMSMSCQKKGSARGVQPTTATKTSGPTDAAKDENKNVQTDGLKNIPDATEQTVVTSGDRSKAKTDDVASTTSGDKSAAAPVTKKNKEETPAPVAKEEATKEPAINENNPIVLPEVKVVGKKTTPSTVPAEVKECSADVVKAQQSMTSLYNKIVAMDKVATTTSAEKEANYTAYYNECRSWTKLFVTENVASCSGKSFSTGKEADVNLHPASWNTSCYKYSEELKKITKLDNQYTKAADQYRAQRIAQLKTAKLSISDEAKDMFAKENTDWKMFIVEGEIQTDSAKLVDAVKAKKMACTVSVASLDKYTDSQNVIVSITDVADLIAKNETDEVKTGIDLAISIRAESKEASVEENAKVATEKSLISCTGIELKDVKASLLKKAFGKHITILDPAAAKEEPKANEKKEEAVKQK